MHFSALAHTPRAGLQFLPKSRCATMSPTAVAGQGLRKSEEKVAQPSRAARGGSRAARGGFRAVRERLRAVREGFRAVRESFRAAAKGLGQCAKGLGRCAKGSGRRAKGLGRRAKGRGFDAPDEGAFGHFHAVGAGRQPPRKIPVVPAVRRPQPVFCFLKSGFRILRRVKKCVKVRSSAKKVYLCMLVNAPLRILSHSRTPQGHFHSPLTAVKQIWKRTTNEP